MLLRLAAERVGALSLSNVYWVCRSALTEASLFLFLILALVVGIGGLIFLLNAMIMRQAEGQQDNEAAHTGKHLVSSEPECFDTFRAACYAWCWSA